MSDIPWIVKASANWNERQHPRDHGQFASKPGAGGATDRHNPDLDAAFADAPAKPKPPAGDMRRNTALDEFMGLGNDGPAPARPPARPPTGKAPQGKIPKGKKAAVRALAAKATGQLKLAAAAEQAGDHKAAQSHRAAAHGYNRAARHQEKGDRRAAVAVAAIADEFAAGGRQLNAVPGAGPNTAAGAVAPTPQPPPARASQPAPQAGPAAAPRPAPTRPAAVPWAAHPAAKPAPAKPQPPAARPAAQPPALPHHRSEQAAQQAAKAVVQAARGGGDVKQAHGAAMQSLDAHLKAGLAELDRRGGNPRHKQAFAKKIAAARAKLNGLAGVDHPRTEPRASVQRPAVRRGFGRHKGVSVPWLVKAAGHDVSGEKRDDGGKWTRSGGGGSDNRDAPGSAAVPDIPDDFRYTGETSFRLYRAANDEDANADSTAFAEERSAAETYLDNPGYGGENLYRADVEIDSSRALDMTTHGDPVTALAEWLGVKHPGAIGVDEWVPQIADKLLGQGIHWVRVPESNPPDTVTWVHIGGGADDPELRRIKRQ